MRNQRPVKNPVLRRRPSPAALRPKMIISYLGIGSNLGNRKETITSALRMIDALKDTSVLKVSSLIETQPLGGPAGQPLYLNGAARITTSLSPRRLLTAVKTIERSLGRKRSARNGPRAIDIDILLYADTVVRERGLVIPHERMFAREFVLRPLAQIFNG